MPFNVSQVCFACRRVARARYDGVHCQGCGVEMHSLGSGFRPPKRRDVGAWADLERFYLAGGSFPGACRCCGLGHRPKKADRQVTLARKLRYEQQRVREGKAA